LRKKSPSRENYGTPEKPVKAFAMIGLPESDIMTGQSHSPHSSGDGEMQQIWSRKLPKENTESPKPHFFSRGKPENAIDLDFAVI